MLVWIYIVMKVDMIIKICTGISLYWHGCIWYYIPHLRISAKNACAFKEIIVYTYEFMFYRFWISLLLGK